MTAVGASVRTQQLHCVLLPLLSSEPNGPQSVADRYTQVVDEIELSLWVCLISVLVTPGSLSSLVRRVVGD